MKLALVGWDPGLRDSLSPALAAGGHQLQLACGLPAGLDVQALLPLGNAVRVASDWETLLVDERVDAIIVGPQMPFDLNDVLRKLVQAALPLVLVHPICESLVAYELNMIHVESHARLYTWTPGGNPAAEAWLADFARPDGSPLGDTTQLLIDCPVASVARDDVLRALARDAVRMHRILGRLVSIQAVAPAQAAGELANLSLSLVSSRNTLARWSASPQSESPHTLRLVGNRGTAELALNDDRSARCTLVTESTREEHEFAAVNELANVLQRCAGESDQETGGDNWVDTCRALEVADTVDVSLRRGRTIDLIEEAPTEEGSFKGMMAAGSCVVLLLALLILVFGSVFEGLRVSARRGEIRNRVEQLEPGELPEAPPQRSLWLRLWPVYPLAIFLILQLLVLVAKRDNPTTPNSS